MPSGRVLNLHDRYASDRERYRQKNRRNVSQTSDKDVSSSDNVPGWQVVDVDDEILDVGDVGDEMGSVPCVQPDEETGSEQNCVPGTYVVVINYKIVGKNYIVFCL